MSIQEQLFLMGMSGAISGDFKHCCWILHSIAFLMEMTAPSAGEPQ